MNIPAWFSRIIDLIFQGIYPLFAFHFRTQPGFFPGPTSTVGSRWPARWAYKTGRRHHAEDDPHRAGAGTTGFPRIELEEGTHPALRTCATDLGPFGKQFSWGSNGDITWIWWDTLYQTVWTLGRFMWETLRYDTIMGNTSFLKPSISGVPNLR